MCIRDSYKPNTNNINMMNSARATVSVQICPILYDKITLIRTNNNNTHRINRIPLSMDYGGSLCILRISSCNCGCLATLSNIVGF